MKHYLIGYPLGYSYSPQIHKLFNLEIDYSTKKLNEEEFDLFMKEKDFSGLNITIPYKEKVIKYLDEIDELSKSIGAVNTVVNRNGKLIGYNTDFYGVLKTFEMHDIDIKDKVVMILGSGGTYKTCKHVCSYLQAKKIIGVSRTKKEGFITYEEAINEDIDILINTTPVGTYPDFDKLIINIDSFKNLKCILDMIYNPFKTELLVQGEYRKIKCINGLAPLVYQAGKAQEIFFDKEMNFHSYYYVYYLMEKALSSIALIGMPGAGKSKIGKALAKKLNYEFIDTDKEIEKMEQMTVSEIFKKYGEEYFREKEEELIKKIAFKRNVVISTGGGMIENPLIMKYLKHNCHVIYLKRDSDEKLFDGRRPKLKNKKDYLLLKERREPLYTKYANICIYNNSSIKVALERILAEL